MRTAVEGSAGRSASPSGPSGVMVVAPAGQTSTPAERVVQSRAWLVVGAVAGVVTVLWMTRHAFGSRPIGGGDITADLVRADFGIAHLVAHGRLDGWTPRFMLGQDEFLFNGPGVVWAAAAVRGVTLGSLSTAGAVKVLGIGALCVQPLAAAYLVRSFGLDRVTAALAGLLSLTATTGYGLGIEGLFTNGLLSHQVGAIWFFVCFGAAVRLFDEPTPRRVIVVAVSAAALAITHLISLMVLVVMLPVALAFRVKWRGPVRWSRQLPALAAAGTIAFALAGFWTVPFVAHRNLHGPVVTWGTDPLGTRVGDIVRGTVLYQPLMAKVVVLAWIVVIVRAVLGHRDLLVFLAVPTAYLLVAHGALHYLGPGDVTLQLANRGLAYAGVIALIPVAALLSLAARRAGDWVGAPGMTVALCAVAMIVVVVFTVAQSKEHYVQQLAPATQSFRDAALQLRRRVPPGARFSVTRDYPDEIARAGVIEPQRWLAWASGVDTLNAFNPEASNAGAVAYTSDGPDEDETIADWLHSLQRLGVSHVVVDTPRIDERLKKNALAHAVWSEGPVTIYDIRAATDAPALLDPGDAHPSVAFSQHGPERLRWSVDTAEQFTATIAVAWSPDWHATLDGHAAHLARTDDALMQLTVPRGRHTIRLAYRPDLADRAGVMLSIATLAALAGAALWRRRRDPHRTVGTPQRDPTEIVLPQ